MGLTCAVVALVAGCHKAPEGQVAATVNGEEVTLQELNTELQNANLPPSVDKKEAQRAILQRVIDRKLMVDAAKEKGIDKSPEYLANKRRGEELLLAQTYAKQQLSAVPVPTDSDIAAFVKQHDNAFGKREQLTLDQIRFPAPKDPQSLRVLDKDHDMATVAAHLTAMGIKYQRGPAGLDTARAPAELIKAIDGMPAGEPFVIPSNGVITVNVITSRKPLPVDPAQAKTAAVNAWRQQKFGDLLNQQLAALKSSAKITYQDGFAPPAPAAKKADGAAPADGNAAAPAPAVDANAAAPAK